MSALTDLIYQGSDNVLELTRNVLKDALAKHGPDMPASFPMTAYYLPAIYAATGVKVTKLSDLEACIDVMASLISHEDDLASALNAGLATAVGAEIIEAVKYAGGGDPYENESGVGFVPDAVIRSLGVPLVTGDIPGVAVVIGSASDAGDLAGILRDYQSKGLLTFLVGDVIEQAVSQGVKIGLDYRVVPLGHGITPVIHVVTVAVRAALIFGSTAPGNLAALLSYTKERIPAFINTFGPLDPITVSAGAGAIALGFPVVTDQDLGEAQVPGALESVTDHSLTAEKSLALRGIKTKTSALKLPVAYAAAFEGEIVRRGDMHAEFNGERVATCELLVMRNEDEVEDHKITLIGQDIDGEAPVQASFGVVVEVFGKRMQRDFESVIERKFHSWLNHMEGVMHTGQRNIIRIRINKESYAKGLRLKDFGEVYYSMVREEFASVVDKCQVTIITDEEKVRDLLKSVAMPIYEARDNRLTSMVDESVDTFYTCVLCQSFAPSHCCVITPERLGLCGAVSWLDAKATKELDPAGPCQPIEKKGLLDEESGIFEEVNRVVHEATHGALDRVSLYSIMKDPMTSCGCFECICGLEPASNGVLIVNREYQGTTPIGMTFGELASMTGGGMQTPGFMGHGKHFIGSKKFMRADGGISRIVWMPKELKDEARGRLDKTALEMYGIENFTDMICDETIANDEEGLIEFLRKADHPALKLDALM